MKAKDIDAILWIVALIVGIFVSNKYLNPSKDTPIEHPAVEKAYPEKTQPPVYSTGIRQITKDKTFGTISKDDHNKLMDYVIQEDEKAFNAALLIGIRAERMTIFKKGENVFLVDTAILSSLVKVRRKGQLIEYWIDLGAISNK